MIRRPPRSPLFPYTPLSRSLKAERLSKANRLAWNHPEVQAIHQRIAALERALAEPPAAPPQQRETDIALEGLQDRKSTRLNSSHANISYAVFCLKKKKKNTY